MADNLAGRAMIDRIVEPAVRLSKIVEGTGRHTVDTKPVKVCEREFEEPQPLAP
jgi:hypothetical protein